ncbi:MAG: beta-galactosidase, partial [Clostridia bacterium]|nr:beta-galactosidase [Clostridia bacterium]
RVVLEQTVGTLAMPNNLTPVSLETRLDDCGAYEVEARLMAEGETRDVIVHAVDVPEDRPAPADDEFVTMRDGEFWLHGKPWYAFGINYWPLYYPGLERDDYWQGWLDPCNYDPLEVERDLTMMEEIGFNCLFTRLEATVLGRGLDALKDFMLRCERHGMKLSLSYCNLTSPLHYQPDVFRVFMKAAGLIDNPVMFSHDLAWEVGGKFFGAQFTRTWRRDWAAWIDEQYGSLAAAEADWGVPVDFGEDGGIDVPPQAELRQEGPWRVKVCAFRRFIDDFASRAWNKTVSDIRSFDPRHLIAYRMGSVGFNSAAITGTNKHIDFASPEGYDVANNENGLYTAAATTLAMQMTTGGKPVVWSEYGMSLTDVRWRGLVWDNERSRPYAWKEEEQTAYLRRIYRMFRLTNVRGSAPWWFPGGFRRVEMSDFGFCGPDGLLRPGAQSYVELGEWFKAPREVKAPDRVVELDPDAYAAGWGRLLYGEAQPGDESAPIDGNGNRLFDGVRGIAPQAVKEAVEKGETIAFRTPGTGSTSADAPRVAVGNVPLTGHNPPRFLNAEWNWIEVRTADGVCRRVGDHACVSGGAISVRGCLGNTQEAKWLRDAPEGAVSLEIAGPETVSARIGADTPYLGDAVTEWAHLTAPGEYRLRLRAEGVSAFGEIWRIRVLPE